MRKFNVLVNVLSNRYFCSNKSNVLVYNWKNKIKEPLNYNKILTWYICGPTVYDSMHIGHASCFIKFDIIRRILENYFHVPVFQVMNITDLDDKIISKAHAYNKNPSQIAKKYEIEFVEDLKLLNIKQPDIMARVTDFIPQILNFIQDLQEKDLVYSSDGSLFFDTTKYKRYGKLFKVPKVVKHSFKRSNLDFALWKAAKAGEPSWNSSWGPGRPGWHIECSAIASYYFGSSVDIHSGGIDLLFPHHENEEAQCCAYHKVDDWVKYWIYTGHLHIGDSIKMSKSLKNTISVKDLLKLYTANQFRTLCLLSNFKNDLEFSDNTMNVACGVLNKFDSFIMNCYTYLNTFNSNYIPDSNLLEKIDDIENNIRNSLMDNFNTSKVVNLLIELINVFNKLLTTECSFNCSKLEVIRALNLVSKTMDSFGIDLNSSQVKSDAENNFIVDITVNFREKLRKLALQSDSEISKKDILQLCDILRADLSIANIIVQDINKSSSWRYDGVTKLKAKESPHQD
ncbi:Cysteine-tRNA ligase,Cysteinyl-tRNA synthetase/mycothiol ligase,tRNA synthetases class I [Cinara cedri]|uniref:cysteine--tRNA ligase n=1 Tax=Cinara cedri TaxID=506608 RepID=A0A5E4MS82_9HEMI|nr:Cysteine-tRNA ligase,Cysteinyl-tRNA synthetase/mycothiol ligase,tRNA synthetases class I [Cinara cedri]